jgi:glutathione S-transferase
MKAELISHKLCPFVQRSVIMLLEKQADFDITYIDISNRPDWFMEISPLGKVPALRVGKVVIFESAVINEYLDEVNPPSMHPADPLARAQNRSWIEFGSGLIDALIRLYTAKEQVVFEQAGEALRKGLAHLEAYLQCAPYFNGESFSLIDCAYAPLFMRLQLLEARSDLGVSVVAPKAKHWGDAMLARDSVQRSVVPEFAELFAKRVQSFGGYAAGVFA